ncbi:MAG: pyridoxal-phosphate dependent enzyme [Crocinitomicaceae bacterium]|nr:pyridoxal-phosphate dependent enzyme [Crocinitomicaceae bacterium]
MNTKLTIPSPLQKIEDPVYNKHNLEVFIKRDDLIHAEISGNKWRKLKYNFEKFKSGKYDAVLTFGGAYSNHIAATASAGKIFQIPTIGIIRGDELNETSNATLSKANADGMNLVFVSREIYEQRYERIYHEELRREFGNVLIIEEGGANFLGAQGVAELVQEISFEPDYIYTAAGTGTTAAGLLLGTKTANIIAISALKNGNFLRDEIGKTLYYSLFDDELVADYLKRLTLETEYHFGGYGKYTDELLNFMQSWKAKTGIALEQVYTAKMIYAFEQDILTNQIAPNSKVVLLHTGGLQGVLNNG